MGFKRDFERLRVDKLILGDYNLVLMDYHRRRGRGKGYYLTERDFEGKFIVVKRVSVKEYLYGVYSRWKAYLLSLIIE